MKLTRFITKTGQLTVHDPSDVDAEVVAAIAGDVSDMIRYELNWRDGSRTRISYEPPLFDVPGLDGYVWDGGFISKSSGTDEIGTSNDQIAGMIISVYTARSKSGDEHGDAFPVLSIGIGGPTSAGGGRSDLWQDGLGFGEKDLDEPPFPWCVLSDWKGLAEDVLPRLGDFSLVLAFAVIATLPVDSRSEPRTRTESESAIANTSTKDRQPLRGGGWFDLAAVDDQWSESVTFDGLNYVSDATGKLDEHEALCLTRKGAFVLHHWSESERKGTKSYYKTIDKAQAVSWLIACGYEEIIPDDLASDLEDLEV